MPPLRASCFIFGLLLWVGACLSAQALTVTTNAATAVGAATAQISGAVTTGISAAELAFDFGTTTAYGSQAFSTTPLNASATMSGSVTLVGLTPGTTYHFRAKATDSTGTVLGSDLTFTTEALPTVVSGTATATDLTISVTGSINPNGGLFTSISNYGTTPAMGSTFSDSTNLPGNAPIPIRWSVGSLHPGTTYYYQLQAKDASGNIYSGNIASITTAPAATPPTAQLAGSAAVTTTSATVEFNVTAGSSDTTLIIEYGPTTSYGSQVVDATDFTFGQTYNLQTVLLTGLTPGTLYHYQPKAFNNEGTLSTGDFTFTTATPPTVTTGSPTGITDIQATLGGSGVANNVTYTASFDYGPTAAYGLSVASTTSVRGTATTNVTANTTGLIPATTYHYRLKLTDSSQNVFYGSDATFTTNAPASPPTASTLPATSVTANTAYFNAAPVSAGSSPATLTFQYGTDTTYGSTVTFMTLSIGRTYQELSMAVTGLQPGTTYHYQATITNNEGSASGVDQTFTTLTAVTMTTLPAVNITSTGASLSAMVNGDGMSSTVSVEYGLTTSYGSTSLPFIDPVSITFTLEDGVGNLLPSTTYHFRARLDNPDGTFFGDDLTFTTAAPSAAASTGTVSASTSTTAVVLTANNVSAGATSASVVFEYGTTTAYGTQTPYGSTLAAGTSANPSVTISGLQPDTLYHYRVDVTNSAGTVSSADSTFITPGPPVVTTGAATNVSDLYATLNGSVNAAGNSLNLFFDYGLTTAYGSTVDAGSDNMQTGPLPVAVSVKGLTPATPYHCHLYAVDGNTVVCDGGDTTFTTSPASSAPTITSGPALFETATNAEFPAYFVFAGDSPATVSWDYGTDTTYGSTLSYPFMLANGEMDSELDGSATNLTPSTTYHFRARLTDAQGTIFGSDETFTTSAALVSATTAPATQVTSTTATLNGTAASNGGTSLVTFQYGPDTTYGASMPASFTSGVGDTAAITGLQPGATYHYRIVSTNTYGTAYGMDMTFTTPTGSGSAPSASTGTATGGTTGTATFRGTVNAGGLPTFVAFEWGTTIPYAAATTPLPAAVTGSADTPVSISVTGLLSNATYHYRIVAVNSQGITYGADATMKMVALPTLTKISVLNLRDKAATIDSSATNTVTGSVGSFGYYIEYGTTTSYGTVVQGPTVVPVTGTVHVDIILGNSGPFSSPPLQPGTTYHFRIVAFNPGGYNYGPDTTFTTQAAFATAANQGVTGLTATSATLNYQVTETAGTDLLSSDYGTTPSYGFNQSMNPTMVPNNSSQATSTTLTGLTPGTTYHYRLRATRTSSNSTFNNFYGSGTFTTYTLGDYWRLQNFGNTSNSGNAADTANPTGDGINNLMKYALGLDPNVPSAALPQATPKNYGGTEYLSYTFIRNPNATDITYEADAADSPAGPWTAVATSALGAVTSGPGFVSESPGANGMLNVEVHDTTDMSTAARRFMRLQVTR